MTLSGTATAAEAPAPAPQQAAPPPTRRVAPRAVIARSRLRLAPSKIVVTTTGRVAVQVKTSGRRTVSTRGVTLHLHRACRVLPYPPHHPPVPDLCDVRGAAACRSAEPRRRRRSGFAADGARRVAGPRDPAHSHSSSVVTRQVAWELTATGARDEKRQRRGCGPPASANVGHCDNSLMPGDARSRAVPGDDVAFCRAFHRGWWPAVVRPRRH